MPLKKIMLISILSLVSINIFADFKDNKITEEYFGAFGNMIAKIQPLKIFQKP